MALLGITVTSFKLLSKDYLSFGLELADQAQRVLQRLALQFQSRLIHLWPWRRGLSTSSPRQRHVYFWMLFPGLLVELYSSPRQIVEHVARAAGVGSVIPNPPCSFA